MAYYSQRLSKNTVVWLTDECGSKSIVITDSIAYFVSVSANDSSNPFQPMFAGRFIKYAALAKSIAGFRG